MHENRLGSKVTKNPKAEESKEVPYCGIIRPIASMGDYPSSHWSDVHAIISEAIVAAGYEPRLVSDDPSSNVILGHIVSSLFNDEIIVCDVSGKNPNVMFELGMRIAFEKPVIIITDDKTEYSFDLSPIRHLQYPRSLKYDLINSFKIDLSLSIKTTIESHRNSDHRGYLQQFGPIKVANIETQEVTISNIVSGMSDMRRTLHSIENRLEHSQSLKNSNLNLSKRKSTSILVDTDKFNYSEKIKLRNIITSFSPDVTQQDGPLGLEVYFSPNISGEYYRHMANIIKNEFPSTHLDFI